MRLKTKIKKVRVRAKSKFYLHWRPMAQKLFFPTLGVFLALGCLNHERIERGTIELTNPTSVFEEVDIVGEVQPTPKDKVSSDTTVSGMEVGNTVSVAGVVGGTPVSSVSGSAIEAKIREVFYEAPEEAIKIASCESRFNPEQIGDEHLTFTHNGQVYGKSIGLFQVRTGGKERNGKVWTRSNDVSAFEESMKDPEQNIDLAKKIWSGKKDWSPWYNCAKLVGIM